MMSTAAVALAAAAASTATTASAQSVSLVPPMTQNTANPLSAILSPAYAGMGIEPTSLYPFTGTTERNNLTYTLLTNLQKYTGVPPHIRVGGNAGDTMLYNASSSGYTIHQNAYPSGSGQPNPSDLLYFGPSYFEAMDNFPEGTPITYGLNLAYQGSGWLDGIVAQANASLNGVQNVNIVGFEIGNEPDLYGQNQFRTDGSWTPTAYGNQWQQAAVAIYNNVLKAKNIGTNFFEPAATATTATSRGQPFRIANLVSTGVAAENGIYIAGWNQHDYFYYLGVSSYQLTSDHLLDLSATSSQFKEWRDQSQDAYNTGKPYYLREMGSVGPTGIQGISDTFANTLWTFHFFLYAATVQVASVQIHMTAESYASPWQPTASNSDGSQPHVRSSYYAFAAIDQIIGATCNVRVAQYSLNNIPSGYTNRLASYNTYTDGNLQTLIAINTQPAPSGSSMGTVTFTYTLPAWSGKTVYLSQLTAAGSDATQNTTWNGMSYEASGTGTMTQAGDQPQQVTVGQDGLLSVRVRDSQAVVVNLGSQIGTQNNQINTANCQKLASSTSEGNDVTVSGTVQAGSAGSSAPTFSSQPTGYNPFRNSVALNARPELVLVTLVAAGLGSLLVAFS
ncbi:hypothetical protein BDZ90DRAFT_229269 [Jaminaea rosea]|uniref:Beta-glucuronidase C-terminal domain-containing protein n=1 Tax=Jaminaea rosea TaxID=1569628 RepID=A0A316V244_9BASI|nr:hypothetical protein BDZ90DRAFT_229269 [Jaminaea rosea]PWN30253.1 hypothetical protein BDZ90DRAFT_229269 [Jaminaea rosea]